MTILLLMACRPQEPPPLPPVATVNGEVISQAEFLQRMARETILTRGEAPLQEAERESVREEILQQMIEERIILQRARELGLAVSGAELERRVADIRREYNDEGFSELFGMAKVGYEEWKDELRRRILLEKITMLDVHGHITVGDDEAERFYNANRKLYLTEGRVRAAQIVVRDKVQADEILKRLKKGEEFDRVARDVSIGPEAIQGGDLGFFERGVMPEAIDRIVRTQQVGTVSRVIQSPYGFHIIKLLAREAPGGRTFAEARDRVVADLRKLKEEEAYAQWIERLKAKANIQINRPLPPEAPSGLIEARPAEPPAKNGK
jgi:parvulin-like peptidyl-prolyl isomerase